MPTFVPASSSTASPHWDRSSSNASEELAENLGELRRRFESLRERIEERVQSLVGNFDNLIREVSDAQRWIGIATSLINLIRLGVQVVSCLSPPALGCLWGLLAQVGIEVALDLVMGTQWFEENVANPTIRDILRRYAGRHYQSLIDAALTRANLTEYASDVDACQVAPESQDSFLSRRFVSGGLPEGPALRRHRDAWDRQRRAEIQAALRQHFVNSEGRPATGRELRDFLEQIDGMDPQQIQRLLERGRQAGSGGQINIAAASPAAQESAREEPETEQREAPPTEGLEQARETGAEAEGERRREGAEGGPIPVLDARRAERATPEGPSGSRDLFARVAAQSGHNAPPSRPAIEVTVFIYERATRQPVLRIDNVRVR